MKKPCPWCNATGDISGWLSEASKYVHLVADLMPESKNVIDIGSGGWPVVPHAIQIELTMPEFTQYTAGTAHLPIQWKGNGMDLPFKDQVADVVFSSHLIEDIVDQQGALAEWSRVLKPGGLIILMHPDREMWNYCINHLGQPPNCAHKAERRVGEFTAIAKSLNLTVVRDEMTNLWEHDYNIITIFKK
jgi:SAM-dependent methyltransferase